VHSNTAFHRQGNYGKDKEKEKKFDKGKIEVKIRLQEKVGIVP
jgi:hypothetical protein